MLIRSSLRTALLALLPAAALAQQAPALGLGEYLGAVKQHNLDLQAQRESVVGSQAGIDIAGVRPDPQFSGGIASKELSGANKPSASTATTAGLAFTLETGGKREARLNAARSNLRLAQAGVAAFTNQLLADAAAAFVELCRARATLVRRESSLAAMRDVVRSNETRFKAGDIGRLELLQSRVEADRFQADVVAARSATAAADLGLANFLGARRDDRFPGREPDCEWRLDTPDGPADGLVALALDAREDVRQARAAVDNARANVELAQANRKVDPTLNVGLTNTPRISPLYDAGGAVTNSPAQHSLALSLTLSVPIPLSRLQQGELAQARSAQAQAEFQLQAALLKAETDVRVALAQHAGTATNLRSYSEHLLADADQVLDGQRTSYRKGAASLLDLLAAQRSADEVVVAFLQARADEANAAVHLLQSLGRPIQP